MHHTNYALGRLSKQRAGEQRGVTPCRKASLQWIVMAAGKCPQEGTDPYPHLLVVGEPAIGGAEGAAPAMVDFSRRRRRRAEKIEIPRRRRRRAEKINISSAEGAAPKKSRKYAKSFTFAADPIIELKK